MPTVLDLEDKRVVITAGAAGIGRVIAKRFMEAGARVHICDRDDVALTAAAAALPGIGATQADVAEPDQVARVFDEATAALGGLDILVNNAGIAGPVALVEQISIEDWRATLSVNLDGAFHCARLAAPLLKAAGGGCIVNMSSTAGLFGFARRAPYVASKWALIGFTKTLAMELGPHSIRVNAICPGCVEGERIDRVIAAEAAARGISDREVRDEWKAHISMRSFVTPDDVAAMVLFVCSDGAGHVSGQAIAVDCHTESK
ncbi:MAG TPA: SDR family oxidoreductase [Acidobacteriota bacterium]|nr:SDR family oxidoreductase [Acidobacteriota bacterium]